MNGPNFLSVSRILMTPPAVWAIVHDNQPVASLLLLAALVTDFLDGFLARRQGSGTELGKVLDPLADKVLAAGVLAALVSKGRVPLELALVVVLRDLALLGLGWYRVRAGGPVPSAEMPGKVAFAILGVFLAWEVLGTGWPSWTPGLVGTVYVLGGLPYVSRLPGLPLGRVLKEER